jgi:hypothetical protein
MNMAWVILGLKEIVFSKILAVIAFRIMQLSETVFEHTPRDTDLIGLTY